MNKKASKYNAKKNIKKTELIKTNYLTNKTY